MFLTKYLEGVFANVKNKVRYSFFEYIILSFLLIISLSNILLILNNLFTNEIYIDMFWRWQEGAYVLKGINPINVINGIVPADTSIGELPPWGGTVPWAYLLDNVFVMSFLPYEVAKFLSIFTHIAFIIAACYFSVLYLSKLNFSKFYRICFILLILANPNLPSSFEKGNFGSIGSFAILIAILIIYTNPIWSGVLIGIASVKPQLAALFYIALLLKKKYKTFIVASLIPSISFLIVSIMTSTSPIKMLIETNTQGIQTYENGLFGFFRVFIQYANISRTTSLLLSVILSLVIIFIFELFCFKYPCLKENNLVYFSIYSIVSLFWFYKQNFDYVVILVLVLAFLINIKNLKLHFSKFFFSIWFGFAYLFGSTLYIKLISNILLSLENISKIFFYVNVLAVEWAYYFTCIFCFIAVCYGCIKENRLSNSNS